MRAMAILYIGPHRNPDFASDYHISPILAPSQLLAQFPPLLMQCGEKDPFVDDTIIFAGRVREAKRQRKDELRRLIFDRMNGSAFRKTEDREALEDELDKLESEEDDDWVQMQIFPDWSHGYLQMPLLMKEATEVIDDLAKWIEGAFNVNERTPDNSTSDATSIATSVAVPSYSPPKRSFVASLWPWGSKKTVDKQTANGSRPVVRIVVPEGAPTADADFERSGARSSMASETETDADDLITLVPKARRPSQTAVSLSDGLVPRRSFQRRASSPGASTPTGEQPAAPGTPDSPPSKIAAPMPRRPAARPSSRRRNASGSRVRGNGQALPPILLEEGERQARALTRSPKTLSEPPKPGTPTKAGVMSQTLTEVELVRRRRLLDSHIFQSDATETS
jgi:hypothetical protein